MIKTQDEDIDNLLELISGNMKDDERICVLRYGLVEDILSVFMNSDLNLISRYLT
jgi:hypothetical protein